jgi:HK97 family phage portal protein
VSWWDRWVWNRVRNREALTLEQLLADEGTPTASGESVTTDKALRHSTIWACTRLLADSVSSLPLDAYRRGEREPLTTAPPLLQRPSADFDLVDWLYATMMSLLLRGNAYGLVTGRSGGGLLPSQVDLLHPDHVGVTVNGEGRVTYRLLGEELDPADVWHVRAYVFPAAPNLPPVGLSPVSYLRESIAYGLAAEKYGARFFGDSATPQGVLTSDERITQEVATDLQERWDQRHKGRRRIAVLGSGAKFQAISISPEESQFVESQRLSVQAIARIYGIPSEMVNGPTSGHEAYTSPEQRAMDFLVFALRPWLSRIERAVGRLLPRNQYARFNASAFVRTDLRTRYEAHKVAIEAGFLTVNEVRELEDRPPLPEPPAPEEGVA